MTPTFQKIAAIVCRVTGVSAEQIKPDGMIIADVPDDLDRAELGLTIEADLDVDFDIDDWERCATWDDLEKLTRRHLDQRRAA
jgi:acyl carrier protein